MQGVSEGGGDVPPSEVEDFFFKLMDRWLDLGHTFCQIKKKTVLSSINEEQERRGVWGGRCPSQKLKIFF